MALGDSLLLRKSEAHAAQVTHAKLPYAHGGVVRREQQTAGAEWCKLKKADGSGVRSFDSDAGIGKVEGADKDWITQGDVPAGAR